jgi:hypothetical protein
MTNLECIHAKALTIDPTLASPIWQDLFEDLFENSSRVQFMTELCHYHYSCFVANETFFSDPAFLQGSKRGLPSGDSHLVTHALAVLKQRAASPHHPHLAAYAEHVQKRTKTK